MMVHQAAEGLTDKQRLLFAQRKVEFLQVGLDFFVALMFLFRTLGLTSLPWSWLK